MTDIVERLRFLAAGQNDPHSVELAAAADEIERLREALEQIAIYGGGMLNQPAALNGPEEEWLKKRIAEYERVARAALGEGKE